MTQHNECRPDKCGVASEFTIVITGGAGQPLKVRPDVLAVLAGDRVAWKFADKDFSVSFPGAGPFETSPGAEPGRPRVIHSDNGVVVGEINRDAVGGAYFYDVILSEEPRPGPGKGVLLVEVTAGVIVRGPVDPV